MAPRNAAALVIGNEILSGKIQEGNMVFLARELRELGVALERIVVVPDDVEVIARDVLELSRAYDAVFTSGGVGPTHDDVTVEAVARAFGRRVVRDPTMEGLIRAFYGTRLTEGHLKMADVPEGVRLVSSEEVRWPTMVVENVYLFPGIPEIFRAKFPVVRERFRQAPWHLRMIFTNLDEGVLKAPLDRVVGRFPAVQIGSYPKLTDPEYRVKLTLEGKDRAQVDQATAALLAELPPEEIVRVE
ncbi:MAG: competence/damage-inducible protein A [Deltaproteobacteria bacterium]|nr:competence/damage-inducible protein A [Deltaproteobacteria bacterium]